MGTITEIRYDDLRKIVRTGDVFTFKGSWLCSKLIRYLTRQPVSHVGLANWINFGSKSRLCIFQSMEPGGVELIPFRKMMEEIWTTYGEAYWQPIIDPSIQGLKVMDYCFQRWGDKYADPYQFIIGLSPTIQRIRKFFGKSLDTDAHREHCSCLVTKAFIEQGYKHEKEPAITTPGDVSQFGCIGPRIRIIR